MRAYLGAKLSEALGQSFVVENRPGGGAVVGSGGGGEIAARWLHLL